MAKIRLTGVRLRGCRGVKIARRCPIITNLGKIVGTPSHRCQLKTLGLSAPNPDQGPVPLDPIVCGSQVCFLGGWENRISCDFRAWNQSDSETLPLKKRYAGGNPEGFHVKVFGQAFFKKLVGAGKARGFFLSWHLWDSVPTPLPAFWKKRCKNFIENRTLCGFLVWFFNRIVEYTILFSID